MPSIDLSVSARLTFLQLVTTPMAFIRKPTLSAKSAENLHPVKISRYMVYVGSVCVLHREGYTCDVSAHTP